MPARVHPTATIEPGAELGEAVAVALHVHVREGARVGQGTSLGKDVYVDAGVVVGANCKVQNGVSLYRGLTLEDGVFVGPHAVFTNDRRPRAVLPDGVRKGASDWTLERTVVRRGASVGANATVLCGVEIGAWAMVGAGAVVTRDVPAHALVVGAPARIVGWVCACGAKLDAAPTAPGCACGAPRAGEHAGGR